MADSAPATPTYGGAMISSSPALLTPSWFAAVMGTGIVANAAAGLPRQFPGLRTAATVVWVGAVVLLILLAVSYLRQRVLRSHAADPVAAQFFGAPPMALLTVGAGALLLGRRVIGLDAALAVDWAPRVKEGCMSRPMPHRSNRTITWLPADGTPGERRPVRQPGGTDSRAGRLHRGRRGPRRSAP